MNFTCGIMYYHHIGKTGGTTIESFLYQHDGYYGQIRNSPYISTNLTSILTEMKNELEMSETISNKWLSISHHNYIPGMLFLDSFLESFKTRLEQQSNCTLIRAVTFREPIQHALSVLYYLKVPKENLREARYSQLSFFLFGTYNRPSDESFQHFLQTGDTSGLYPTHKRHGFHLPAAEILESEFVKGHESKFNMSTKTQIETALKILAKYDIIGYTHNLETFMTKIMQITKWQKIRVKAKNVVDFSIKYPIEPQDIVHIIKTNKDELEFYYKLLSEYTD